MRNALIAFVMSMIIILTLVVISTVDSKTTRQNELDTNLGAAIEQSMVLLTVDSDDASGIEEKKELIAHFIQNFLIKTTSDSAFTIDVITADAEKGLLDVKVTETFNTYGGQSNVEARRTIILEDYVNEENVFYTVSFMTPEFPENNGEEVNLEELMVLKKVKVHGGDSLAVVQPPNPSMDGYTFKGWKCTTEDTAIFEMIFNDLSVVNITEDYTFEAVFEAD